MLDLKATLDGSISEIIQVAKQVEERIKVLEEKEKKWEETQKMMESNLQAAKSKIVFDVGGQKFATSKATILRHNNSLLSEILASGCKPDEDGSYFIGVQFYPYQSQSQHLNQPPSLHSIPPLMFS